jgi:hypothetical protein
MRDENGTFIGNTDCMYWNGVAKIEERTCCGGRITKCAFVNCEVLGEVSANSKCLSFCSNKCLKGVKV